MSRDTCLILCGALGGWVLPDLIYGNYLTMLKAENGLATD